MKWWPWIVIAAVLIMQKASERSPGSWSANFSRNEFIKPGDRDTISKASEDSLKALVTMFCSQPEISLAFQFA
jgi:hypothetical protein